MHVNFKSVPVGVALCICATMEIKATNYLHSGKIKYAV